MSEALLTFVKGGVHPPDSKILSKHLAIETMPLPEEVDILLLQHFGVPCKPIVSKKSKVSEGDVIGETQGLGTSIHASVTGIVRSLDFTPSATIVSTPSITIQTDPGARARDYAPSDWKGLSARELLEKVRNAGIVGIGGAGFPTHVKLSPPPEARLDTLIINGAEIGRAHV